MHCLPTSSRWWGQSLIRVARAVWPGCSVRQAGSNARCRGLSLTRGVDAACRASKPRSSIGLPGAYAPRHPYDSLGHLICAGALAEEIRDQEADLREERSPLANWVTESATSVNVHEPSDGSGHGDRGWPLSQSSTGGATASAETTTAGSYRVCGRRWFEVAVAYPSAGTVVTTRMTRARRGSVAAVRRRCVQIRKPGPEEVGHDS